MKNIFKVMLSLTLFCAFLSCEKDEGKLPEISLKTGGAYTSSDVNVPTGTASTIGINASKSEKKDVLKKFNNSSSLNAGSTTSVLDKDLGKDEEDIYSYDHAATVSGVSGDKIKYTFTVTNRDGLINQASLTVTIQ